MNISSTSFNPSSSVDSAQQQSPSAKPPKSDSNSSTVVTLSEQGKKLSQSQNQASAAQQANQAQQNTQAQQNAHAQSAHANQPPGIPAIEGKSGRVSTYA